MPASSVHFRPNYNTPFVATLNRVKFTIEGRPLTWKRVAGRFNRYDQQKGQKRNFIRCLKLLYNFHPHQFVEFGRRDVELRIIYIISPQWEGDVDNYAKFTMDCLQMQHVVIDGNPVRVFDDDICVRKLVAEKRYGLPGERLSTTIEILPYVFLVE